MQVREDRGLHGSASSETSALDLLPWLRGATFQGAKQRKQGNKHIPEKGLHKKENGSKEVGLPHSSGFL